MNDAIFKFKRYEDASLSYTGIDKHAGEAVGGWDTVIRREEYDRLFASQQETMTSGLRTSSTSKVITAIPEREKKVVTTPSKPTVAPRKPIVGTVTSKPLYTPKVAVQANKEIQEVVYKFNVGTKVRHKLFGDGEITWFSENKQYFYVKFEKSGSKTFTNPKAFADNFIEIIG